MRGSEVRGQPYPKELEKGSALQRLDKRERDGKHGTEAQGRGGRESIAREHRERERVERP